MYVKRTVLKGLDEVHQIIKSIGDSGSSRENGIFTQAELDYCAQRPHCLGARFVIKECILDYIEGETGLSIKNYSDIEITHNEFKKPVIRLLNGIRECVSRLNIKEILISISHSRKWISGMVLFCYETNYRDSR